MAYGFIPETRNLVRSLAAASFTPSSGPSDATRARLNDKRIDKLYTMTAAASPVSIVVDLGSAQAVDTAAVLNHNLASLGSGTRAMSVTGADDAAITVNVVGPYPITIPATPTSSRTKDTCMAFTQASRRYWRFSFSWFSGGSLSVSVGELVLGAATTLGRGELDGSGETERVRAPTVELANGGTRAIFLAGPVLERHLSFSDFSVADNATLRTLWRDCRGPAVPVLWCEDWAQVASASESQQKCLYGHLQMPEYAWRWSEYLLVKPPDLIIRSQGREVGA